MEHAENTISNASIYRIQVEGLLQEQWAAWFNGSLAAAIEQEPEENMTAIQLNVPDQAALRGVVNMIWDLNLSIISIVRL